MTNRASLFYIGIPLLLSVWGSAVCAATYHVSPLGSNTPPYATIESAAWHPSDANSLATGYSDTVLLHVGEYIISSTIFVDTGVTWIGDGADSVVLRWMGATQPPIQIVRGDGGDNLFTGICFFNPNPAGLPSLDGLSSGNNSGHLLTVKRCRFHGCRLTVGVLDSVDVYENDFEVWSGYGILYVGSGQVRIHYNHFSSATRESGYAIFANWGNLTIENNVFDYRRSEGRGFLIYIDRFPAFTTIRNNLLLGSQWPIVWDEVKGVVENNTILWGSDRILIWLAAGDTLVFRNNILYEQVKPVYPHNPCPSCFKFVHNALWPPTDSIYNPFPGQIDPADTGNISAFPMFADDSLYHLQFGSPLIDAGAPDVLDGDGSPSDIGWAGGPGGITYTYFDLPPSAPESIWVDGTNGLVTIAWSSRPEADLAEYRLYRGTMSGFWAPGMTPHRVLSSDDTMFIDSTITAGGGYYYVVTAVDAASNESPPSPEGMHTITGILDGEDGPQTLPRSFGISRVYPNPFNASTLIELQLPTNAAYHESACVAIFNVLGRQVASLPCEIGSSETLQLEWVARDLNGDSLPSGIYFARLTIHNQPASRVVPIALIR